MKPAFSKLKILERRTKRQEKVIHSGARAELAPTRFQLLRLATHERHLHRRQTPNGNVTISPTSHLKKFHELPNCDIVGFGGMWSIVRKYVQVL